MRLALWFAILILVVMMDMLAEIVPIRQVGWSHVTIDILCGVTVTVTGIALFINYRLAK